MGRWVKEDNAGEFDVVEEDESVERVRCLSYMSFVWCEGAIGMGRVEEDRVDETEVRRL